MEPFGESLVAVVSWILLILGYAFSIGLLCVPFIRLKEISRAGNHVDGDHLPVMYLMSLINSMAWLSYGCLDPQSNAVVIINLVASVVHFSYTVWYICLCEHRSWGFSTGFALVVVLLFFGIMACIHAFFPAMFRGGHDSLNTPVTITAILMYIGPIPDMVMALWNDDAARMSFPVVLASFGNALFWGEYGRLQGLKAIRMSNEWGILSPILQLAAYHWLKRNDIPAIYREEIPQLFHQFTETLKYGYTLLRRDEEEKEDD